MTNPQARIQVTRLSWLIALLTFAVIVIAGADIRPEDGSTGCASWGDCSGWTYLTGASGAIGASHLAVAGLIASVTAGLVAIAWVRLKDDHRVTNAALLALALMLVQIGALFAPAARGVATWAATVHLGATALLLATALYLVSITQHRHMRGATRAATLPRRYHALVFLSAAAIFGVLLSGAYLSVAGSDACTSWPLCDSGVTAANLVQANPAMTHRALVLVSTLLIVGLAIETFSRREAAGGRRVTGALLAVVAADIVVGAFSLGGADRQILSAAHFGIAAAAWSLVVVLALGASADSMWSMEAGRGNAGLYARYPGALRDYIRVTKPGIMVLLLTTTLGAMLVAAAGWPSTSLVIATLAGGVLASGGASALNCYLDRDIDVVMARTRKRPLPTGRLAPSQVRNFGLLLSALAVIELALLVNPVAALLALAGNLFYVVIYTRFLKRSTPQNIVIGGAAGAFPPLVGWAAVTGTVALPALLLFAIIYYWTPPHFWSLALLKSRDYERAGIPMLPVTHGQRQTRKFILLYSLLLLGVTTLPVPAGAAGPTYLAAALILGGVFVAMAARMYLEDTSRLAWRLFKYSNYYLALLLAAMVVDRVIGR